MPAECVFDQSEPAGLPSATRTFSRCDLQRDGKGEAAPFARLTLHPDSTAVLLNQAFAYCQSQPVPSLVPGAWRSD